MKKKAKQHQLYNLLWDMLFMQPPAAACAVPQPATCQAKLPRSG